MILILILFKNKKGVTGSGVDEGKKYISFVRGNMDQIDKKITDDLWALSAIEVKYISLLSTFIRIIINNKVLYRQS